LSRPLFHLAPLFRRPEPSRGSVSEALRRQGEVAIQPPQIDPQCRQTAGDLGALGFGRGARTDRGITPGIALAQTLARCREQFSQLGVARLHAGGLFGQVIQLSARQSELNREFFFGEFCVPLGFTTLAGQAPDLGLHFRDEVFDPLQVHRRFFQSSFGTVLPVSVKSDARRLLEEGSSLLRPVGEQ
jgi:hypothetical protein